MTSKNATDTIWFRLLRGFELQLISGAFYIPTKKSAIATHSFLKHILNREVKQVQL